MKLSTIIVCVTCVALVLLAPSMAFAKSDLITVKVTPETPAPNQSVVVSIQSYAVDLNSANITWYVDKVVVKDGRGEKNITTSTKEFGQTATIDVVISMPNGERFDKQYLLKPVEVDLLWEADTYVPPFYKGKALPTYQSMVKLSAIPRFNSLSSDPSSYSYTWTANQIQGIGQGLGKSSVVVPMKYSGTAVPVSVQVSNLTGGGEGSATQNIMAVEPQLYFYEEAPLLGTRFDRALSGNVNTSGVSFILRAVPYFFSNENMGTGDLIYSWKKDAVRFTAGLDPNILTLEKQGSGAQGSGVALSVQNRKHILQRAGAQVSINFSGE